MKRKMFLYAFLAMLLLVPTQLPAADFDWMPNFNVQAQVNAVLSNFPKPADAYVALRLGEMSGKPIDVVTEQYRTKKGQGWGALAKSLGIKPGSKEFHALKRGDDLYGPKDKGKGKAKKDKKNK